MFCIYLRTNSDLCHLQHKLTGFYHRNEKLLLRGTNWLFKQSSLRFVFKGLSNIALRIGKYRKKLLFYPPLERCICQFPLQTAPTLVRGVWKIRPKPKGIPFIMPLSVSTELHSGRCSSCSDGITLVAITRKYQHRFHPNKMSDGQTKHHNTRVAVQTITLVNNTAKNEMRLSERCISSVPWTVSQRNQPYTYTNKSRNLQAARQERDVLYGTSEPKAICVVATSHWRHSTQTCLHSFDIRR